MYVSFLFFFRYYDQLGAIENKLPISEGQVSDSCPTPYMAVSSIWCQSHDKILVLHDDVMELVSSN